MALVEHAMASFGRDLSGHLDRDCHSAAHISLRQDEVFNLSQNRHDRGSCDRDSQTLDTAALSVRYAWPALDRKCTKCSRGQGTCIMD